MHFGTKVNALCFGVKKSNFKVMVVSKLWILAYLRPKMNWLNFEGCEVIVKVTARSDVKKLGSRLRNGLEYHNHI